MPRRVPLPPTLPWSHPRFGDVAPYIESGDLVGFAGRGCLSTRIAREGRGPWSHVGVARVTNGSIGIVESREFYGVRLIDFAGEVRWRPGELFWWPLDLDRYPEVDGRAAAEWATARVGEPYGYLRVLRCGLSRTRGLRLIWPPDQDDDAGVTGPMYCSDLVSAAFTLAGGIDPVPGLAHRSTEPNDLYRSRPWRPGAKWINPS